MLWPASEIEHVESKTISELAAKPVTDRTPLGQLTPIEFEVIMTTPASQAA